jgi:hypothetical protein
VIVPARKSGGGPPQSKTLPRQSEGCHPPEIAWTGGYREASWSAPAPWRFWRIPNQKNLKLRQGETCRSYGAWKIMAVVTRLAFVSFVSRFARIQPQQAMTEIHDGVTGRGEILFRNPWWQRSEDCSLLFSLHFHPKPARVGDFVAVAGFPETGKRALCQLLGHWWHISC